MYSLQVQLLPLRRLYRVSCGGEMFYRSCGVRAPQGFSSGECGQGGQSLLARIHVEVLLWIQGEGRRRLLAKWDKMHPHREHGLVVLCVLVQPWGRHIVLLLGLRPIVRCYCWPKKRIQNNILFVLFLFKWFKSLTCQNKKLTALTLVPNLPSSCSRRGSCKYVPVQKQYFSQFLGITWS